MRSLFKKAPSLTGPIRSFYNYYFGEKEIKFLFRYLKKYKKKYIFIDIGANYGIYTFLFAKKSEFTFAIEPIVECVNYLNKGYRKKNIEIINKVASNNKKNKTLNIPVENNKEIYGKSSIDKNFAISKQINSESFRVDELLDRIQKFKSELLFIKIDVEGHENLVIEGSLDLFNNKKTLLLIEIEKRHNKEFFNLFNSLKNLGFLTYCVRNRSLYRIEDISNLEEIMKTNINFLFKNY